MNEWLINLPEDDATFLARVALAFVLCLGAIIGSFLNVCIYRIPIGQSVSRPRSHCFGCGRTIPWYLNIPILSWFILRGRCAYCKSPISARYPFIEALTALLFLLVFLMWGNPSLLALNHLQTPELIPILWLFVASTVVNVMIDLDHRILLDRISLIGTPLAIAASAAFPLLQGAMTWHQGLIASLVGGAAGFGIGFAIAWLGERIFLQDAFGFGDVKWLMLFGALFGWSGMLYVLMLAAFLGLLMGAGALAAQRLRRAPAATPAEQTETEAPDRPAEAPDQPAADTGPLAIPFGPALGAGALLWLFWGRWVHRGLLAAHGWALDHRQAVLLILVPILLLTTAWLLWRIRAIRRAIREEESAEPPMQELPDDDKPDATP